MRESDRKFLLCDLETDTLFIFNDELFVVREWADDRKRIECDRVGYKNTYGNYRFGKKIWQQSFAYDTSVRPVE